MRAEMNVNRGRSASHPVRARLAVLVMVVIGVVTGCGREGGGGGSGAGSYGPLREAAVPPAPPATMRGEPARGGANARAGTNALLTVLQTEWSPATLWHSRADRVAVFANLPAYGLGGPTFLAYASPTGITSLKPGMAVDGAQLRENWLMAGFPGASGWTNWDSPWAVFLQHRPREVRLETNGVELRFGGEAGYFSLLPLYGAYKPPQQGRGVLKGQGLKEKNLLTWEWPTVVARDPLTRLRYWAGVTRRFPVGCRDEIRVDRGRDTVTLRETFEWLEVPDDWRTVPISLAPVSPTLGLAMTKGQTFPVRFARVPFDFELATPYGPYFGVPNAEECEMEFPVLKYVHETESPVREVPPGAPEAVGRAWERLRATVREALAGGGRHGFDSGGEGQVDGAWMGALWFAKALPYLEADARSNVVARLGRYLRDEVMTTERFEERESPAGRGRMQVLLEGTGRGGEPGGGEERERAAARLLQLIWAYVHFSGDHGWVRERWAWIRKLGGFPAGTSWVGVSGDGGGSVGDEAASAVAYARLAYLAGDRAAYESGCATVARELVLVYARQRGGAWFREQQPWNNLEPIGEEAVLARLGDGVAGWEIEGPTLGNRWDRFHDPDVARFYREELGGDARRELKTLRERWEPGRWSTDGGPVGPSLLRLESLLANAAPTNLTLLGSPEKWAGPASGILASSLAMIRASVTPRYERLIPGGGAAGGYVPGPGREATGPGPMLLQAVAMGGTNAAGWPRILWSGWKTPTGEAWTLGEVRAGDRPAPAGAGTTEVLSRGATRIEWR